MPRCSPARWILRAAGIVLGSLLALGLSAPPRPARWCKEAAAGNSSAAYTLAHAPDADPELAVFLNGLYQTEGADYSLNGRAVVFSRPLSPSDAVRFWYLGR